VVRYGTLQHVAAPYGALPFIAADCGMLRYGRLGHVTAPCYTLLCVTLRRVTDGYGTLQCVTVMPVGELRCATLLRYASAFWWDGVAARCGNLRCVIVYYSTLRSVTACCITSVTTL